MKPKDEIENLANSWSDDYENGANRDIAKRSYIAGYTQCQEDNKEKKYTEEDIINALHSVELKNNKNYSKIYEGMKEYLHSLNKQD
jgi:hypothetical protein